MRTITGRVPSGHEMIEVVSERAFAHEDWDAVATMRSHKRGQNPSGRPASAAKVNTSPDLNAVHGPVSGSSR